MKLNIAAVFFLFLFLAAGIPLCFGDDILRSIEIPSSFNPVGAGARALGMGGAFIAVADDATAASWNPGGLVQLEQPEIAVVYDMLHRTEAYFSGDSSDAYGDESVTEGAVNYMSAAFPFTRWGRSMVVSVNYQRLYDFNRQRDFRIFSDTGDIFTDERFRYRQDGNISALGLAGCVRLTPAFSFGVTLNIWNDELTPNHWKREIVQQSRVSPWSRTLDRYTFEGINANFGILWNATPEMTVGAVLKAPFSADLSHENTVSRQPEAAGRTRSEDETLEMPMSFGLGIAYRFTQKFTLSFDIYRTEWDDFILTNDHGQSISPVTGKSAGLSRIDPTHQVRLGMEYLFITNKYIIPLCAGVFYDPAPAPDEPDDIFGFSIGSGIGINRLHLDMAWQYRFGDNTGNFNPEDQSFSQEVKEHTVYLAAVVHF